MGFFDLFMRQKTPGEFFSDALTKGDLSTKKVDGTAVALALLGAAAAASRAGANVSHAQSTLQDAVAREKAAKK